MQTITTQYLPPTGTLPARIRAKASAGLTSPMFREDQLPGVRPAEKHAAAAAEFARSLKWSGHWVSGHCGNGYVFVNTDTPDAKVFIGR